MKRKFVTTSVLLLTLIVSACAPSVDNAEQESTLIASVSVVPQKYFVERIGGEHVQVNVMVGPGESPHSYEPKASQMTALSDSDVYFKIGVDFEDAWMPRISSANTEMFVVDVAENITRLEMAAHDHEDGEDHEEDADHDEQSEADHEIDPHVWTSPENGIRIAATIKDTLINLDSDHADDYQANYEALTADIQNLQAEISTALEDIENRTFIVFHPAWGYFANEFDLEQIPVEVDGSEPSPQELTNLIDVAIDENIKVIFAQPEFSARTAENIASEIGGKVLLISPLAENWLDNLYLVADIFAEEL